MAICPNCAASVADSVLQCPNCRSVWGQANHCNSCQAFAPLEHAKQGYKCSACGKKRKRDPESVVLAPKKSNRFDLILAGLGIADGLAVMALLIDQNPLTIGLAVTFAGLTAWRLFDGKKKRAGAEKRHQTELGAAALKLVKKRKSGLSAAEVAGELSIEVDAADKLLNELAETFQIELHVSEEGRLIYRDLDPPSVEEDEFDEALEQTSDRQNA